MNDDQSDIRRSVSMSHGLLMASSPEQVGRKRSRREQTGRPGHRRIHSEPVHVAAPTDDVDLFPMWSLADDPIMALDVEPSTPEWARVMEHCATSFGGGGGDSPGLGLGRKKGNFGDLPGAFYGDDDEDLGATRRNASHSLDAATSSIDPNSSLDLPNSSYGEDDSLCDGLSPMTTEAFRKAILPAIAKDDRAAAAKPPRAAAPRKAPSGKSGKGKGAKGDDAKGDGDKDRGRYKCGRCGQVKVNHVCPFGTATNRNVDAQCEDPERPIRVGDKDGVVVVSAGLASLDVAPAAGDAMDVADEAPPSGDEPVFEERVLYARPYVSAVEEAEAGGSSRKTHRRTASAASTASSSGAMDVDGDAPGGDDYVYESDYDDDEAHGGSSRKEHRRTAPAASTSSSDEDVPDLPDVPSSAVRLRPRQVGPPLAAAGRGLVCSGVFRAADF